MGTLRPITEIEMVILNATKRVFGGTREEIIDFGCDNYSKTKVTKVFSALRKEGLIYNTDCGYETDFRKDQIDEAHERYIRLQMSAPKEMPPVQSIHIEIQDVPGEYVQYSLTIQVNGKDYRTTGATRKELQCEGLMENCAKKIGELLETRVL